jgi:hypothetical protein
MTSPGVSVGDVISGDIIGGDVIVLSPPPAGPAPTQEVGGDQVARRP